MKGKSVPGLPRDIVREDVDGTLERSWLQGN